MKLLAFGILALLSACVPETDKLPENIAHEHEQSLRYGKYVLVEEPMQELCIRGVVYYVFEIGRTSSVAPKFAKGKSTPETCPWLQAPPAEPKPIPLS